MKKKIAVLILASFVMSIAFGNLALAARTLFTAEVHTETMPCYSRRSTNIKYLTATFEKGTEVEILSYSKGWAKIRCDDYTGYAKTSSMASHKRMLGYTLHDTKAYLDSYALSEYMGIIPAGHEVYVVGYKDGYWLVENESGSIRTYIKKGTISKYPLGWAV